MSIEFWDTTTLADCMSTKKGYAFKSGWYTDNGHPIVKVSNFTDDSVDVHELTQIRSELVEDYKMFALQTDDVVVQTVGSWPNNPQSVVGKAIRVPRCANGALLNQNAVRIDPAAHINRKFLFYLLRNDDFKAYIISTAQGAASQAAITLTSLKSYKFGLPPLPTQRKIASILSAYDDLIENNTRRIAILEEMAQAIYREWFVNFRFPGHENVKLVDSSIGQIPEGWEVKKLSHVADVNARSIRRGSAPEIINYIDIKSVATGQIKEVSEIAFSKAPGRARRIVRHGDVIWSTVRPNRRSYSVILSPLPDTIVSTGFAVLSPTEVPFSYLYLAVTTNEFSSYLVNHATGSAYPAVNAADFENAELILPSEEIINEFHKVVGELFVLGHELLRKNENLRTTRDLLLPKLISGKLDVEDLDIDTGLPEEEFEEVVV